MTQPGDAQLSSALDAVAGRRARGPAPTDAWRTYAAELRDLRRRVQAAPRCPKSVLRRVETLYAKERGKALPVLLRLVFDSWRPGPKAEVVPAFRGRRPPRMLRFEGPSAALDVRIVREKDGTRLQVATEPAREGLVAVLHTGGAKRGRKVALGVEGIGQMRLSSRTREFKITVREGRRDLLETPPIEVE